MSSAGFDSNFPAKRAWYGAPTVEFCRAAPESILGALSTNSAFSDPHEQKEAWRAEIEILQPLLADKPGWIFLEFAIPRMGRRVDALLLLGQAIFVLEFKVGTTAFDRSAFEQVWDYALDLKNFHAGSHPAPLIPVLIATGSTDAPPMRLERAPDGVFQPVRTTVSGLRAVLDAGCALVGGPERAAQAWESSPYRPTPTIIEAARALYAQHSVEAIARNDAGAKNLHDTSARLGELVEEARLHPRKIICFVTGVPGAGKTLVGLNLATQRREKNDPTHAVYLSGNGPLVAVLREALTRDEYTRRRRGGEVVRKGQVAMAVKAFIQNVHHYRDEALKDSNSPPADHVAIFDEAQRAWDLRQTAHFMRRKRDLPGFGQSEPEFLISYLDRHREWAAIVCLVGGGQEINTGEAGIGEWLEAVDRRFPKWHVHVSPQLRDPVYHAALKRFFDKPHLHVFEEPSLHLASSMRSFRCEDLSSFVQMVLDGEAENARRCLTGFAHRYPIVLTRDLDRAKQWVRSRARGSERYGLVASSRAERLKPHAIDVRTKIDPVQWFLKEREHIRSSYYLEDAATEFHVQGLELDWTCVTWDGDLRRTSSGWSCHEFRGSRWTRVLNNDNRRYLLNAYRVLLTRARQGMVLFVPRGDRDDPTRSPEFYDATYLYLQGLGLPELTG